MNTGGKPSVRPVVMGSRLRGNDCKAAPHFFNPAAWTTLAPFCTSLTM